MSLIKIPGSPYWYSRIVHNGKIHTKSLKTENKKLAAKIELKLRNKIVENDALAGDEITFVKIAKQYADSKKHQSQYGDICRTIKFIESIFNPSQRFSELTQRTVNEIIAAKRSTGCKDATIYQLVHVLSGIYKLAKENNYKTQSIKIPKIKVDNKRLRYLSPEEEQRLLTELDPYRNIYKHQTYEERSDIVNRGLQDAYDVCCLLLDTGARYNEIVSLEWSQIDFSTNSILLWRTKTSNASRIYLTKRSQDIIEQRSQGKQSERWIFPDEFKDCTKPRGASLAQPIYRALKRAKIEGASIHSLRHTTLSRLAQNGFSLQEVAVIAGHQSVKTTQRYVHLIANDITRRAADILNKLT